MSIDREMEELEKRMAELKEQKKSQEISEREARGEKVISLFAEIDELQERIYGLEDEILQLAEGAKYPATAAQNLKEKLSLMKLSKAGRTKGPIGDFVKMTKEISSGMMNLSVLNNAK